MVASVTASGDVGQTREAIRKLRMPGQRRVHFKSERDAVKKAFIAEVRRLPLSAIIYVCQAKEAEARGLVLTALLEELHRCEAGMLVLERDESLMKHDKHLIAQHSGRRKDDFSYRLMAPQDEPLLWVSDGLAWCWQRGGEWKNLVRDLVTEVRVP
ncbi:hypothetical protein C6401_13765 [Arthrobacter woluwensis]|nr:hypothetical protein C6401_13765 [Arthrobacter woluwensis]